MLNAKRLGVAGGIVWGVSLFITTLIAMYWDYGVDFLNIFGGLYPGYEISIVGSFIGLICGFIDAFIGFFVLAWIYNWLGGSRS